MVISNIVPQATESTAPRPLQIITRSSSEKIIAPMLRSGSLSAKMLTPTVAALQGEKNEQTDFAGIRRTNEPSIHQNMTNGQGQNVQHVPAQPQHHIYWKLQQDASSAHQTDIRHYSFASSMDLISSTAASVAYAHGNSYQPTHSQPLQNDLFKSSSHHTSHTAAAGDLLTMSRRALDPPAPNQVDFFTKKRSVTMADARDNSSQLNFKNSPARSYSVPAQGLSNLLNPLQQQNQYQLYMHAPQHINPLEQKGVFFPNQSRSGSSSVERASSSMVHDLGGVDESHQEHRTIRRCRRSDSFEMMEDG